MDANRFDTFTRTLTTARSRRGALPILLGATLGFVRPDQTAAEKKRKKKKKKKTGSTCPEGQRRCRGSCQSVLICCDSTDCAGGRTCQQGTCACPADKPQVCPGSTICQQCCVKADCTPYPEAIGSGIPECSGANVCVCGPGLRYCPNTRSCGACCANAECSNGQICYNTAPLDALACTCGPFRRSCTEAGRTGCTADTSICQSACGQLCNPEDGDDACPCRDDLVCDFTPGTQADYHCAPR